MSWQLRRGFYSRPTTSQKLNSINEWSFDTSRRPNLLITFLTFAISKMEVGTTAKVQPQALVVDETGQVYLMEDERWPSPLPRFCGAGVLSTYWVTKMHNGYIYE